MARAYAAAYAAQIAKNATHAAAMSYARAAAIDCHNAILEVGQ